jgi:hypothetical protein
MADKVQKVAYTYVMVPDRAGQGAKVLEALRNAKINLRAYSGFPAGGGKAQIDLVPEDMAALRKVAKQQGWKLSAAKRGFLVEGEDRVGAVAAVTGKLASRKINIVAADAVAAGDGRYGMILWVKPRDYSKAAKVLGAR